MLVLGLPNRDHTRQLRIGGRRWRERARLTERARMASADPYGAASLRPFVSPDAHDESCEQRTGSNA